MDGENLGPTAPWQIKDFPVELRRKIIAAAAAENLTVGQYMTRFFVSGAAPARLEERRPSTADLCNLMQAAAHAAAASGQSMPKRTAGRLHRYLDDQIRVVAGLPPRKPQQTPLRIGHESATQVESSVPDLAAP